MTKRSTIRGEDLSITNDAAIAGVVSGGSFSVPTKFDVDGDGNVDAVGTITGGAFAGPGVTVLEKFLATYSDFSDPGKVFDLDLGELAGSRAAAIFGAFANVTELFDVGAPPAAVNVLLELGHATDPDAYLLQWDARTLLGYRGLLEAQRGVELNGAFAILPAGDNLLARATISITPNLDDLATGAVAFYLLYALLP
jgi:hypothetical protein